MPLWQLAPVLLYAASPINNPRPGDTEKFTDLVDRNGRNLIAQEYNEEKWAKAAAAALDVMKLEGEHAMRFIINLPVNRLEQVIFLHFLLMMMVIS